MKHTLKVGKPVTNKAGDVTGFDDVQEVPSNEVFRYNRRGYKTLQPDDLKSVKPAKNDTPESDDDLDSKTVKELKGILDEMDVKASGKKQDLIDAIRAARDSEPE